MVAIKDMEMPKSCGGCNCSGTGVCKEWVYLNGYDLGKKRADTCPLVEIEERKVGKWIKYEKEFTESGTYRQIKRPVIECSICQEKIAGHIGIMNYCPNCGADMRGAENG